jgi:DNA gyrase/topoisomerase IV subunit A
LKEEDLVSQVVHTSAHAYLLLFSNHGKVYRLRGHEIPVKERTARGTAAINLVPLAPNESIAAIIATREFSPDQFLVFATALGQVKKTALSEYDKSRREGFIAINLRDGDELVRVVATSGDDDLFEVTRNGMTIRFNEADVRAMGRDAAGVRGIRLRAGDAVVSLDVAADDTDILIVTDAGYGKRTKLERFNRQARGGQGVRGIRQGAIQMLQNGMVRQAHHAAEVEDLVDRVHYRLIGVFVENGKHVLDVSAPCVGQLCAGERLGHGVEEGNVAFGIGGNDRVANAVEGDTEQLRAGAQLLCVLLAQLHLAQHVVGQQDKSHGSQKTGEVDAGNGSLNALLVLLGSV